MNSVGGTFMGGGPMIDQNQLPPCPSQGPQGQASTPSAPPPEGTQQFCLRWNSYPATVATQLAALRAQEDFVDVTLACEGKHLKAHKLVLSACSPYFMQLFKSTPCHHPVIFLRDVGFRQLGALLEFMYAGEVNVSQIELPALLRTAEALQVRGLADTNTASNNNNNNTPPNSAPTPPPKPENGFPPQQQQQQYPQGHQHSMGIDPPPSQVPLISQQQQQQQQLMNNIPQQQQVPPVIPNSYSSSIPSASSVNNNNNNSSFPSSINIKRDRESVNEEQQHHQHRHGQKGKGGGIGNVEDIADFSAMDPLGQPKTNNEYPNDDNMSGQMEGHIFPDDPSSMGFDLGEGDMGDNSEGETSEDVSDDENDNDGESKEFKYQSDASYSQEGMGEGEGGLNGEGSAPGPAGPSPGFFPGDPAALFGLGKDGVFPGGGPGPVAGGGSGRNRLSRQLWPPGIPYHGPQKCPYCERILSNVGNWRKHVLTMHIAREKDYKCRQCTSAFRTAEYLQKHYVRVHGHPQKMTRRKFTEQTSN